MRIHGFDFGDDYWNHDMDVCPGNVKERRQLKKLASRARRHYGRLWVRELAGEIDAGRAKEGE